MINDSEFKQLLAKATVPGVNAQALHLSAVKLTPPQLGELLAALQKRGAIKRLSIINGGIRVTSGALLAEFCRFTPSLVLLDVSHNYLNDMGVRVLLQEIADNQHVEELDLSNNTITDIGAQTIATQLCHNVYLRELYLAKNNLTQQCADAFATLLQQNGALQKLDLSSNKLGADGIITLADGLRHNRELTHLNLANTHCDSIAAKRLLIAIAQQQQLKNLSLAMNNLDDSCLKPIVSLLLQHKALRKLDLRQNKFSDKCVTHFLEALQKNPKITELDCRGTKISPVKLQLIEQQLQKNIRNNKRYLALCRDMQTSQSITPVKIMRNLMSVENLQHHHFPGTEDMKATLLSQLENYIAKNENADDINVTQLQSLAATTMRAYSLLQDKSSRDFYEIISNAITGNPFRAALVVLLDHLMHLIAQPDVHIVTKQTIEAVLLQHFMITFSQISSAELNQLHEKLTATYAMLLQNRWFLQCQVEWLDTQYQRAVRDISVLNIRRQYDAYLCRQTINTLKVTADAGECQKIITQTLEKLGQGSLLHNLLQPHITPPPPLH